MNIYFDTQHSNNIIEAMQQICIETEQVKNGLYKAIRELQGQTIPEIEQDITQCVIRLHEIENSESDIALCLKKVSELYSENEASIIEDIRKLPADKLYEDNGIGKYSYSYGLGLYDGIAQKERTITEICMYKSYFPIIYSILMDIPDEWLQTKLCEWIREKISSYGD